MNRRGYWMIGQLCMIIALIFQALHAGQPNLPTQLFLWVACIVFCYNWDRNN